MKNKQANKQTNKQFQAHRTCPINAYQMKKINKTVLIYIDWQAFFDFIVALYMKEFVFYSWLLFMKLITFSN